MLSFVKHSSRTKNCTKPSDRTGNNHTTFIYKKELTKNMKGFMLDDFPLQNKTVLARVDFNVPFKNNKIKDDTKLKAFLPTLRYLISQNCKIILATHLGKPKGKPIKELSTKKLMKELQQLVPENNFVHLTDCIGAELKETILKSSQDTIFLLENLRFYKEEEENDSAFAHSLAELAECYVNDAFGVCHRNHASVSAITNFIPAIPGHLIEKEIANLNLILKPKKPAVWIMGGAKLTKVNLIQQALKKANHILIGGALAFSFLKAKGVNMGTSLVDSKSVTIAKELLKQKSAKKLVLPIDFIVTEKPSARCKSEIIKFDEFSAHQVGLDIGPKTIKLFQHYLQHAKTVVWNGPLGHYEWNQFATATKEIGRFLKNIDAVKVAGGGETASAIHKFHLTHNFTHISTGGGAALQFLAQKPMPGVDALEKSYKRFRKTVQKNKNI